MSATALPAVAAILVLGILAQLVSRRLRVPSVLFFIIVGVALGSQGLGIVTDDLLGNTALTTIVGLSVSIIVFDGAFELRKKRIEESSSTSLGLITVGALVTLLGIAVSVHFILDEPWPISFLIGSLLIATGPTVITPILEVIEVREPVAAALETEGIVNDVTAAIAAIVIFETFVIGSGGFVAHLIRFGRRLGVGVFVGIVVAISLVYALRHLGSVGGDPPQSARFLAFAGAVSAYGGAEAVLSEAGIAAAATAGILAGNLEVPHREEIEGFSRDLTLIVLSFVFISLAALLDPRDITSLGIEGIAFVIAVTLIVRPLVVALSVRGGRITRNEKVFMSIVAPRGIIPASVATLFATELQEAGQATAANTLVGAVFLIIFVTVIFQGGFARQIAEVLGVVPMKSIIVGGGRVGRALAERLERRGEYVVIVEDDEQVIEQTRDEGFTVHPGSGEDREVLREVGADEAKILVAATSDDNCNLLAAQHAKTEFGIEEVIARVNQPDNADAFEAIDVNAIDASMATAWTIDNEIERPALAHWMNDVGDGHDVQEIEVTNRDLVGMSIEEVDSEIPDGCIVAEVSHGETDGHVPEGDHVLEYGDHITFLGREEAVEEAIRLFHPHD